jgi:aspartyl-tRNA(Asn)/glutamyl-tRNA(Gln) amidotransferase subunit A
LLLRNPSIANMLDLCAVSIPCHEPDQAPVGLMLMGRRMSDRQLLAISMGAEPVVRPQ